MSFTNQKPFAVDADAVRSFTRFKKRFNCKLCGHEFAAGDTARWVYANSTPGLCCGNFFVCQKCDGPNEVILVQAKESFTRAVALAKQWDIYGPDWQEQ